MRPYFLAVILLLALSFHAGAASQSFTVSSHAELKKALAQVVPGTTIEVAPGMYAGGIYLDNVHGAVEAPIVITGVDPNNPPVFTSRGEGAKLSGCSYIRLSHLVFQGTSQNGINIDDGGKAESPSHHLLLEHLEVRNIGPKGNADALKISGTRHFVVRDCRFENWGGSAIDLVGCQNGLIEGCQLLGGGEGYRNANGIQIKGGSRFILVQNSLFRNAGERIVNLGGMTGLQYFRPKVEDFEAKDITLAGNTFIGGEAQVAWVTAQNSHVHHNLFFLPTKWIGRILQETQDQRFKPSGKGLFENNMVVMDARVGSVPFNVGRGTDPDSFVFRGNAWFRPDSSRKPTLPTAESDGIYDLDPMILDLGKGPLAANTADPRIRQVGPWDYRPWKPAGDFADVAVPPVVLPQR
ncbi:right-handed parallel beta-helix repeat-containing protein [Trichloromonas sp.]|uniref:right-handed parallel beta-helix repeat-containing protein n=1 Tax=Trichloromonas sp. TaxID=3069249 RepID=UPI002A4E0758|nr:right-handed parallel beta-helix repeat-containing protein [Trichloromonas sp.]